jgi:hypothetical protein
VAGFQTFVGGRISAFANRDPQIQGFATEMSINLGETAQFKVKTHSPRYRIDIYRMGWYGGNGARLIQTIQPSVSLPQAQPECIVHNPGITSQSTTLKGAES